MRPHLNPPLRGEETMMVRFFEPCALCLSRSSLGEGGRLCGE